MEQSRNSSGTPATLMERWNGISQSILSSPTPGTAPLLNEALADPVSGQAWVVDNFRLSDGATEFNP
jgi:hypothetical protein